MTAETVYLYVYDISGGMARQLAPMLLGRQLDGVWHTGVVVGGVEWFFGGGVQRCIAEQTPFGRPVKKIELGKTEIPKDMMVELVADLSKRFRPEDYNLITNNCNHFSNELAMVLTGSGIPADILNQAQELLSSPIGQMLMPMFAQMEQTLGGATADGFGGARR